MKNPYIEILRPMNCFMASIATIIGYSIITLDFSFSLILAVISTFIICGAGQAINDVYDAEIDKKVSKKRPIPSGRISEKSALNYSISLFLIGIFISIFINLSAFIIASFISLLLIVYSAVLYKKKYLGNAVVALGTALPFIYGAATAGTINSLIVVFSLSAFFANLARELTKDFEDVKKDKGVKLTMPMINEKLTHRLIILFYFISIGIAVGAFAIFKLNIIYIFFVYLTTFVFLSGMLNLRRKDFNKSQSHSKKGMLMSLIAFVSSIFR
jgi:geranylgeranylglycerol-phosphate geranylgeranyltransferase